MSSGNVSIAKFLAPGWAPEAVPDAAGEEALEAADGIGCALAFGALARDVVPGLEVASCARDRDPMDRGVQEGTKAMIVLGERIDRHP